MRTPGHDFELVLGFLFTEGIINSYEEVAGIHYCQDLGKQESKENVVRTELHPEVQVNPEKLRRNFYTSSACGVCGKTSIEAVESFCPQPLTDHFSLPEAYVHQAPAALRNAQLVFRHTGGLHAAGLFDQEGRLLLWREDVGRHNALDKLTGSCLLQNMLPLQNMFVLLSGRVSFELVQKGLMSGLPVLAAIGAPSSLAVDLARRFNMSLLGFVRDNSFNIYCGSQRIICRENNQDQ